jgi:pimeloyl-ACP methyl ester carboxylesterase
MDEYADKINEALENRGIKQAVMFGHSMGGYITLAFAEKYPEKLLGLGLINSRASVDSEATKKYRHDQMLKIKNEGPATAIQAMPSRLLAPETIDDKPHVIEALDKILQTATAEGMILALHAMAVRKDHRDLLKRIDMPVLVVAGKDDQHVSSEESRAMAEGLQKGTYVEIDSAGHMSMMEQPDTVTATMLHFLSQFDFDK